MPGQCILQHAQLMFSEPRFHVWVQGFLEKEWRAYRRLLAVWWVRPWHSCLASLKAPHGRLQAQMA